MTLADRIRAAVAAELDRHGALLDAGLGLRSVRIDIKLKPSGDIRAAVVGLEFEREAPASR